MNRMQSGPNRRLALKGLVAMTAAPAAFAQQWPSRMVTIVVAWPPGNPVDVAARKVQPAISKALGQTLLVENLPGAGGVLGVNRAAAPPQDGHTLLVASPTELILSPVTMSGARYTPADFVPVGIFGRAPYVLVGKYSLGHTSLESLLDAAKSSGSPPLSIGNAGQGSLIHLVALDLAKRSGLKVTHVPYKGLAPMVQDVMAGVLDLAFVPVVGNTTSLIEQGKMRSYGITSAAPFALAPELVPISRAHASLKGFEYDAWSGVFVPKSTARTSQQRMNQVFYEAVASDDYREWALANRAPVDPPMSLDELSRFYRREILAYEGLAKVL